VTRIGKWSFLAAVAALTAGVLPTAPAARAAWPFGPGTPKVGEHPADAAARILSRAIQIRTVNPPGDEEPLAELFVDVLAEAGVDARVIDTPDDGSEVGRAAAWARVPGNGSRRPIVLLSHLDTVPADVKDLAIARRAEPLDRDVIFLATPDEETGGQHGAGYLVRERRALLYDAELLLTEGGSVQVGEGGSSPVWGVTVTEKAPCWLDVVAEGTTGHSSVAPPDTAVTRLLDALERIRRLETPVEVVPEVARMFRSVADLAPAEDREGFRNLAPALETDPAFRERFLAQPGRAALVRNTVAITVLEGGDRTNVLPGRARAQIDARLLPGQHCADFIEVIEAAVGDPSIRVEPLLAFTTRSSPVNTPLFRAIERVAAEVDPGAPVVPRVIAGFTDAHYFRDLGIVAYGFVPRWLPPSETRGIHGPNERIAIENLERGVTTLVRILEALDR